MLECAANQSKRLWGWRIPLEEQLAAQRRKHEKVHGLIQSLNFGAELRFAWGQRRFVSTWRQMVYSNIGRSTSKSDRSFVRIIKV